MSHNPHAFCRKLLALVMADVCKHFTVGEISGAWVWDSAGGRKSYEFHGAHHEYFHDLRGADCVCSAKAEGWSQMLRARGVEGYADAPEADGAA
jgi:hypothetical protein